jgi:hypothetical protein
MITGYRAYIEIHRHPVISYTARREAPRCHKDYLQRLGIRLTGNL